MKFFKILVLSALVLSACGTSSVDTPSEEGGDSERLSSEYPVVYVSVFTHAEQKNSYTPDFTTDEDAFWEQRQLVVDFAQMLYEKGVAYNYQSDWNFLEAALKFDDGTEETNGKNFLQYLSEDLGVDVDPHNHTGQSEYNYADVAYLISELGVEPTGVVGGYLVLPVEDSALESLWEPVEGAVYDFTWTPEILWGGGTEGHVNDESLQVSGVWRPQDAEHWTTHDPEAPLAVVGNYADGWDGLDTLLDKQEDGTLEQGKMYTISIDAHQKLLSEDFIEEFAEQIDHYQEYANEGRLVWSSITDTYETWVVQYDETPSQYFYLGEDTWDTASKEDSSAFGSGSGSGLEGKKSGGETCGNGVCENFERKQNVCPEDC